MLSKPRSVYIASNMKREEINERFSFLDTRFERTFSCDDADFVVFDLNHPISELQEVLVVEDIIVRFIACKPVILVALEGWEDQRNLDIVSRLFGCEPPVCKSDSELANALEWFRFIFPKTTGPYFERIIDLALHR